MELYGDNLALNMSATQPYGDPDADVIPMQANMAF